MHPDAIELKKQIGVVFQDVAVFDQLSVYDNIDYFCGLYIDDIVKRKQYVQDAIDLVGLNDFVKFKPKKLSGGLLRRLNIACGIAHKPKLIFFDEPTVAVDPQSRNNILEGIKELNRQGATVVYTTHYMEEVDLLCDRIMILDHGKIITEGTSESLKKSASMGEKVTLTIPDLSPKVERATPEELHRGYKIVEKFHNGRRYNVAIMAPIYNENSLGDNCAISLSEGGAAAVDLANKLGAIAKEI